MVSHNAVHQYNQLFEHSQDLMTFQLDLMVILILINTLIFIFILIFILIFKLMSTHVLILSIHPYSLYLYYTSTYTCTYM